MKTKEINEKREFQNFSVPYELNNRLFLFSLHNGVNKKKNKEISNAYLSPQFKTIYIIEPGRRNKYYFLPNSVDIIPAVTDSKFSTFEAVRFLFDRLDILWKNREQRSSRIRVKKTATRRIKTSETSNGTKGIYYNTSHVK